MRSFITGIDGFIGSWLAETLVTAGDQVFGLSRKLEGSTDGIIRLRGDLTDSATLTDAISQAKPDRIFHLAGQNNIRQSFEDPALTFRTNLEGTVSLLDVMRRLVPLASFISAGSSAEYGRTALEAPALSERMPLLPTSPYGISKVSQGHLCRVYTQAYGLRAIHVRPFAIIGPRKTGDVFSDFCRNVVAIERGETDQFSVGSLTSERDFIDVRDCVAAFILVSEKGDAGVVYNMCNGQSTRLETLLPILQSLSRRPFKPVQDPGRLRPVDDVRIVGDNTRLRALGYTARFRLKETVADTLDYWRAKNVTFPVNKTKEYK